MGVSNGQCPSSIPRILRVKMMTKIGKLYGNVISPQACSSDPQDISAQLATAPALSGAWESTAEPLERSLGSHPWLPAQPVQGIS